MAALAGRPAARPSPGRAAPRTGRSPRGCRCRCVIRQPASCSRRAGPMPSARSRSVVGVMQTLVPVVPSSSMSSSVRWVACTTVVSGPSRSASCSSRVGVTPYAARQASFSATCSERWTCSGARPWKTAQLVARHRPHRVDGRRAVARARRPGLRVAVGVAPLHALGRRPEAAAEVAGVQQRDPDPGLARGLAQRVAHRVRVVVRRPVGLVVQVVELRPPRCSPAADHLAVRRPRQREVGVRGRAARRRRTSARARSRTSRAPAGCAPAAPGGRRGCGRWPGRGW